MATLGLDSRLHSQLPSGSVQSNISSLGSQNTVPLNRALERALEEAANSGFLNLSARKLKDFPRTALTHDLTDTVEADLSKNRLTDVPSEVCHLVSLETLNLYHNCIRSIPDSIISLQTLTSLNLSRNQLSVLPACLCGLPLRVLNASNNKLLCLPEAIGQLRSLMELDISCNEITALPQHIGHLKALRELNVRRNFLCVLPEGLAELPLVKLDVSCNKVSTVPTCFRKMVHLQSLRLENNPLQSPPAQICMKGRVHIFKYLTMEECRSDKMADTLYLPVIDRLSLSHPATGSTEDIDQNKKQETDSGVGSDNGDKRLSATEPSDEDSLSLNVPMSHITEEEGLIKDDSSEHISALTADSPQGSVKPIGSNISEPLEDQFGSRDSGLSTQFVGYIKGRATDFDEPLRIEEDVSWSVQPSKVSEGTEIHIDMINQLKETVELLQDPERVKTDPTDLSGVQLYPVEMVMVEESFNGQDCEGEQTTPKSETSDGSLEFQKKRELILERARLEAQLACLQFDREVPPQSDVIGQGAQSEDQDDGGEDEGSTVSSTLSSPPFGLKPRSVFLRTSKSLESMDPQFTMRRKMEQLREELELMEQLRENIESRLKVPLPEDLGSSLMDGVVLCHLVNHIRPRSVNSIHVPSPAVPKLSMAKCRRNVENFLDACRKLGVSESLLCSAYDILQSDLRPVRNTVLALVALEPDKEGVAKSVGGAEGQAAGVVAEGEVVGLAEGVAKAEVVSDKPASRAPSPSWCFWELIGSSIVHLFCLALLFAAYSWSELT
ncbi:leucine-rich repeat and calponin homology domain-containing protein 1-like isoform X3 [Anguilla anguilla]|uniref:leucine-rich repeat and calponin homology domain-containing protein 1-like isoform X3 n=1 Tax=Anguilla anguilla TaxID=7936 RepID=UPI0015B1C799|nr:leucine-rich repeat and calponin homology domain-containing protein 1-like isoform X3 [Anguilla anguilla]